MLNLEKKYHFKLKKNKEDVLQVLKEKMGKGPNLFEQAIRVQKIYPNNIFYVGEIYQDGSFYLKEILRGAFSKYISNIQLNGKFLYDTEQESEIEIRVNLTPQRITSIYFTLMAVIFTIVILLTM